MSDRIFISHANEDVAVVSRIVAYLEAQGVGCWIASRDIPPRSIYAEEITKGIQACSACAVIVSVAANESKAVKRELELASHYDKPFIPIRIDATEPGPGLDYYLRNTQWIDYRRNGERALDRIAAHMADGATIARAAPPAPPRYASSARKGLPRALILAGALAVAALGGWFAWTSMRSAPSTEAATRQDEASRPANEREEGRAAARAFRETLDAAQSAERQRREEAAKLAKERDDAIAAGAHAWGNFVASQRAEAPRDIAVGGWRRVSGSQEANCSPRFYRFIWRDGSTLRWEVSDDGSAFRLNWWGEAARTPGRVRTPFGSGFDYSDTRLTTRWLSEAPCDYERY